MDRSKQPARRTAPAIPTVLPRNQNYKLFPQCEPATPEKGAATAGPVAAGRRDKGKQKVPSWYGEPESAWPAARAKQEAVAEAQDDGYEFSLPKVQRSSVSSFNAALDRTWAGFSDMATLPTTKEEEGPEVAAAAAAASKPKPAPRPRRVAEGIEGPSFLPFSLLSLEESRSSGKHNKLPGEWVRRARDESNIYTQERTDDLAKFLKATPPPGRLPTPPPAPAPPAVPKRKRSAHESLRNMFKGSKASEVPPVPKIKVGGGDDNNKGGRPAPKKSASEPPAEASSSKAPLSRLAPWKKRSGTSLERPAPEAPPEAPPEAKEIDEPYLVGNSVLVDKISPDGKRYTAIEGYCPRLAPGEKLTPTRKFVRRSSTRSSPATPKRSEASGVSKASSSRGSPAPRRRQASIGPPPSRPPPPPPVLAPSSPSLCMETIHRNLTEAREAYDQLVQAEAAKILSSSSSSPSSSSSSSSSSSPPQLIERGESSTTGAARKPGEYKGVVGPQTPRSSTRFEWPRGHHARVRGFQSQQSESLRAELKTRESLQELRTRVGAASSSSALDSDRLIIRGALSPVSMPPPSPHPDDENLPPRNLSHSNVHPLVRESLSSSTPTRLVFSADGDASSSSTMAVRPPQWSPRSSSAGQGALSSSSSPSSSSSRGSRIPRLSRSSSSSSSSSRRRQRASRSSSSTRISSQPQPLSSSTNFPVPPLMPGRRANPDADRFRFPEIPAIIHEVREPHASDAFVTTRPDNSRSRAQGLRTLQPGALHPPEDPFVNNPLGILHAHGLSSPPDSPSSVYSDGPGEEISPLSLAGAGAHGGVPPRTPQKAPGQDSADDDDDDDELEALVRAPLTPEERAASPGSLIPKALRLSAMSASVGPQTPRGDALYVDPAHGFTTSPNNPFVGGGVRRMSQAPRSELEARLRTLERSNALYEMALGSMVRVSRRQATRERGGVAPAVVASDDGRADGEG